MPLRCQIHGRCQQLKGKMELERGGTKKGTIGVVLFESILLLLSDVSMGFLGWGLPRRHSRRGTRKTTLERLTAFCVRFEICADGLHLTMAYLAHPLFKPHKRLSRRVVFDC